MPTVARNRSRAGGQGHSSPQAWHFQLGRLGSCSPVTRPSGNVDRGSVAARAGVLRRWGRPSRAARRCTPRLGSGVALPAQTDWSSPSRVRRPPSGRDRRSPGRRSSVACSCVCPCLVATAVAALALVPSIMTFPLLLEEPPAGGARPEHSGTASSRAPGSGWCGRATLCTTTTVGEQLCESAGLSGRHRSMVRQSRYGRVDCPMGTPCSGLHGVTPKPAPRPGWPELRRRRGWLPGPR